MIRVFESARGGAATQLDQVIQQVSRRLERRGLVILISDLLDGAERLPQSLDLLRLAGHDAMVIHLLDPHEIEFPFDQMTRFEGLERFAPVVTDPRMIGQAYRAAMAELCRELEYGCRRVDVAYDRIRTDTSLAVALPQILARRQGRGARI